MTATQAPPTYSSTQVRYRTGISERQLDYWCQQDWLAHLGSRDRP